MRKSLFSSPLSPSNVKNRKIPGEDDFAFRGLARGTYGLLVADEGVGKSGLGHLIAIDKACGTNFSGLSPRQGKVMIISLEDRELDWSTRQRSIEKDLTEEQTSLSDKNIQIYDLKEHANSLANNQVYKDLYEAGKVFKPDLIIIDYLDKWAEKDLVDVDHAKYLTKSTENLAMMLNCGVLFLHHTNKGNGDENKSARDKTSGAIQYQRNTKWRGNLEKNKKSKDENSYVLDIGKARSQLFKLYYNRRNDRCGIPYWDGKADTIKEHGPDNSDIIDLSLKGGKYPSKEVAPMSTALLKKEGIFGSFATNQERPKLKVKIELGKQGFVELLGADMLGPLEAKILIAIIAMLNEDGIRLCIPNYSKHYENLLDRIEDNCSYTMEVETTCYQIHKLLYTRKGLPCSKTYDAIRNAMVRLRSTTVIYRNGHRETALNLIDHYEFAVDISKFKIRINPFLVDAVLGIDGISFTKIPISIIKQLKSDISFILYQRLKSIIRKTDTKGIVYKIDTLLNYLYPFEATYKDARKDRMKSLRKAIKELEEKTDFHFAKEGRKNYRIFPAKLSKIKQIN